MEIIIGSQHPIGRTKGCETGSWLEDIKLELEFTEFSLSFLHPSGRPLLSIEK